MSTKKSKSLPSETAPQDVIITSEADQSLPETTHKTTSKKSAPTKTSATSEIEAPEAVNINDEALTEKKKKSLKKNVIRDSFSFPEHDYLKITELKKTCLSQGVHVKKGEVLRAGLLLLSKLSIEELILAVEQVEKVKTGRPNS